MPEHKKPITRRFSEAFVEWCADNSPAARLERTIAQGIIGIAAGIATAALTGNGAVGTVVAPMVMAVLSPIQASIGKSLEE